MRIKLTQSKIVNAAPRPTAYELNDSEVTGLLLRVESSGVKTYFLRYRRPNRKQTRVKLGRADSIRVAQARELAKRRLLEVAQGVDPMEERRKAREQSLGEYLAETYYPMHVDQLRSGAGVRRRLDTCFKFLHDRMLSDRTIGMAVQNWMAKRKKAGKSASTINRDISDLRGAFSYAIRHKLITEHPLSGVRLMREEKEGRVRYLESDEERALIEALEIREEQLRAARDRHNDWCRERGYDEWPDLRKCRFADYLYPIVLLAMHTGLRRGELFNLQWEDLKLDASPPLVTVRAAGAKSGKTRHVELSDTALKTLRDWRQQTQDDGYVFPSPKSGGRLDNINKSWKAVVNTAGIADFRFHDLRHDFASKLVMSGVDLYTVCELLGHADIKMTSRYAHLSPNHKHAAVRMLDRVHVGRQEKEVTEHVS